MSERDLRTAFHHLQGDVMNNVPTERRLEQIVGRRTWVRPAFMAFAGASAVVLIVGAALLALRPGSTTETVAPATGSTLPPITIAETITPSTTSGSVNTTTPTTSTLDSTSSAISGQALDLSEAMWVTHGLDGIRLDDGTLIWETQPFPTGVARDRQGGLVFTDSTGLWWFQAGVVEPERVAEAADEVLAVATTPTGPVALIWGAGPGFYNLIDGTPVGSPDSAPVEISSESPWLAWTAANGLSAWVTEPEVETDSEGQPSKVLEPAHLVIADESGILVDTRIADSDQAWATIHDFDGQKLIISRGPYEPAMPEESFLLVDLATGEAHEIFKAGATRATFTGADTDWNGPVQTPNVSN